MSATVTERHRELARELLHMPDATLATVSRKGESIAQAISDAEERGREAGIREAAGRFQGDCIARRAILALLPEVKR